MNIKDCITETTLNDILENNRAGITQLNDISKSLENVNQSKLKGNEQIKFRALEIAIDMLKGDMNIEERIAYILCKVRQLSHIKANKGGEKS